MAKCYLMLSNAAYFFQNVDFHLSWLKKYLRFRRYYVIDCPLLVKYMFVNIKNFYSFGGYARVIDATHLPITFASCTNDEVTSEVTGGLTIYYQHSSFYGGYKSECNIVSLCAQCTSFRELPTLTISDILFASHCMSSN